MCGAATNINSCQTIVDCKWVPDTCASLSSSSNLGWQQATIEDKNSTCSSDPGCQIKTGTTHNKCTLNTSINSSRICANETTMINCHTDYGWPAESCKWYFTCEGKPSNPSGNRQDPYGGNCVPDTTIPNTPTPPVGGGGTPLPGSTPTTPPQSATSCSCGVSPFTGGTTDTSDDNFCHGYPSTRNSCLETNDGPDGYCDLNSDGIVDSMNEVIAGHSGWTLGAIEYQVKCGTSGPPADPTSTPPPGATNTPTPAPVDPTGDMVHACSADQTLAPSYDLKLENINPTAGFQQANFQFCMNPTRDTNHAYIFVKFFEGKGQWVSEQKAQKIVDGVSVSVPVWSCYSIGRYTTIPGGGNAIYHTVNKNTVLYFEGITKTINEMVAFTNQAIVDEKMSPGTEYDAKVVLITNSGVDVRVNDQIVSRHGDDKGHVQFHTGIGTCAETGNGPTLTPPLLSCSYVNVLLPYTSNLGRANNSITQEFEISGANSALPGIDVTKPIKVGADWGWHGLPVPNEYGPVLFPNVSDNLAAGSNHQSNETSNVVIKSVNPEGTESELTAINCIDVGEWRTPLNYTPFSDGRIVNYNFPGLGSGTTNLKKVFRNSGGNWYTCPISTGNTPLLSQLENTRPQSEWREIALTPGISKLKFIKNYTGGDLSRGTHFTRIWVSYCAIQASPTNTLAP